MKIKTRKDKPTTKAIQSVFDCWNERGPVKHRVLSMFKGNINAKLKFYSVSQLCRAIRAYQEAHFSGDPRFWYGLTLNEFLLRPEALGLFLGSDIIFKDYHEPCFMDLKLRLN